MRLKNKAAIVTGGGTGIGKAICHKFAREGARLVIAGLPGDPIRDVANAIKETGAEAIPFECDTSDPEQARNCVDAAVNAYGKLDILINNAGVLIAYAPTEKYRVEDFDYTIRHNVRSAFLMTKYSLPYLHQSRGCIVSAGSEAGYNGTEGFTPYGGTKAFMHAFMKGVALEQAKRGVRANCVCPGPIDTAWLKDGESPMPKKVLDGIVQAAPMGRRGTPAEVANVYAFLASDEASFVTGALWLVDGGITPGKGGGDDVPKKLREQPEAPFKTPHQYDGLRNKEIHQDA